MSQWLVRARETLARADGESGLGGSRLYVSIGDAFKWFIRAERHRFSVSVSDFIDFIVSVIDFIEFIDAFTGANNPRSDFIITVSRITQSHRWFHRFSFAQSD